MGQKWDDFLRNFVGKERADRHQEKKTGMTYAQRQIARDPDAEVALLDFTPAEMDEWREGGDPFRVGPQKRSPYEDREIGG
jgi:hypothetical protein